MQGMFKYSSSWSISNSMDPSESPPLDSRRSRRNLVLIDLENVQPTSLDRLTRDNCHVILFVGAQQTKIPIEVASALQVMGDRAEYVRISASGPNALDFHLAFYAGLHAQGDPAPYIHIVSKDKGIDPLIHHMKSKEIPARRSDSIDDIPMVKKNGLRSAADRAAHYLEKLTAPKSTRPRTAITLARAIQACFNGSITSEEVPAVIEALESRRFLAIEKGKVVYNESIIQQPGRAL